MTSRRENKKKQRLVGDTVLTAAYATCAIALETAADSKHTGPDTSFMCHAGSFFVLQNLAPRLTRQTRQLSFLFPSRARTNRSLIKRS